MKLSIKNRVIVLLMILNSFASGCTGQNYYRWKHFTREGELLTLVSLIVTIIAIPAFIFIAIRGLYRIFILNDKDEKKLFSPVSGAEVTSTFTGDYTKTITKTTGPYGAAVITTSEYAKKLSYTFCVDNVSHGTLTYDPYDNIEICKSK